eukprot:sb/3467781/
MLGASYCWLLCANPPFTFVTQSSQVNCWGRVCKERQSWLVMLYTARALECEWEKKEKTYLPNWTSNAGSTLYTTLAEAQAKCVTLGTNCGGITLMSNGYTLRAGSGFVNYDHETSWKKLGCPVASDKVFKVNSISPGQGSRQGGTRITISGQGFLAIHIMDELRSQCPVSSPCWAYETHVFICQRAPSLFQTFPIYHSLYTSLDQEPTDTSKQPIRTRYLGHVTGYQPIRDQHCLIWSDWVTSLSCSCILSYTSHSSCGRQVWRQGVVPAMREKQVNNQSKLVI